MNTPKYVVIDQPLPDIRLPHGITFEQRGEIIVAIVPVGVVADADRVLLRARLEEISRALASIEVTGG